MEMNDRNEDRISSLLQEKWAEGFGLHVQGIVFAAGAFLPCEGKKARSGSGLVTAITFLGESSVSSVLAENNDAWVHLTECDSIIPEGLNLRLSCGEGQMGNEGYVAVCAKNTNRLIWFAFFECSNPFSGLRFEEGVLIAENSYEQEWGFPLNAPQDFWIRPIA